MPDLRRLSPIFACAALAASGCGSSTPRADDYDPGTTSQAQFQSAASLCEKQADLDEKNMGLGLDPTRATYGRMFDACMRASGFTRKPPPK